MRINLLYRTDQNSDIHCCLTKKCLYKSIHRFFRYANWKSSFPIGFVYCADDTLYVGTSNKLNRHSYQTHFNRNGGSVRPSIHATSGVGFAAERSLHGDTHNLPLFCITPFFWWRIEFVRLPIPTRIRPVRIVSRQSFCEAHHTKKMRSSSHKLSQAKVSFTGLNKAMIPQRIHADPANAF